jgi:predicted permease
VTIIAASVPSASAAYVLARQMGGNAPLMAEILTIQTLMALISMPVLISLLGG